MVWVDRAPTADNRSTDAEQREPNDYEQHK